MNADLSQGFDMMLQQLEKRVDALERDVAELREQMRHRQPFLSMRDTFGMFANDPEFDEIVRLGREYRDQENAKSLSE